MSDKSLERKNSTLKVGESKARLMKRKSEIPGYTRVDVEFDDIYRGELVYKYNWTESQIESFDVQLFAKIKDKWWIVDREDKELFHVDIPTENEQDVISYIESALKLTFEKPLQKEETTKLEQLHLAMQDQLNAVLAQEREKVRIEKNMFQAYKTNSEKIWLRHDWYCAISKIKIKKVSGITFSDEEFLWQEYKKIATKSDMIIMKVSVSDEPFDRLYKGRVIQKEVYMSNTYESELQKIIKELSHQDNDIVKISHSILSLRNKWQEASGERVQILCTEDFANKVTEYIKNLYADLDDISNK